MPREERYTPRAVNRLPRSVLALTIGTAVLANGACKPTPAPAQDAAPRALPPPTRPADLLLSGHFGQPAASARALSSLASMAIPFELGMSLMLGFDSTMLAAVDLAKPIDVAVTGTPEERDVTVAFFPAAPSGLRSTLSTRFRMVTVAGVGEKLEPRAQSGRDPAWRCAIVGAPGEISSRLVCSTREAALGAAARWLALESSRRAEERDDALFEVDGATARSSIAPSIRRSVERLSALLGSSAQQARQEHSSAPQLGDPEPLIERTRRMAQEAEAGFADLQNMRVKVTISAEDIRIDADAALDPAGRSTMVQGTQRALGASSTHALVGRLPPNAPIAGAWRTSAESLRSTAQNLTTVLLDVLGSRIPSADLARADLEALFAHVGDEVDMAFGPAPELPSRVTRAPANANANASAPAPQWELWMVMAQDDNGTAASALVPRLARAPWLTGLRIGDRPGTVSSTRNQLVLRLPPRPAFPLREGEDQQRPAPARPASNEPPTEVSLAVSQGQLAMLVGPNTRDQLRRLDARTAGPAPTVLGAANEAPFVMAVDARALRGETPPAPVHVQWRAEREGATLSSRLRVVLSGQVIRMLRRARREE